MWPKLFIHDSFTRTYMRNGSDQHSKVTEISHMKSCKCVTCDFVVRWREACCEGEDDDLGHRSLLPMTSIRPSSTQQSLTGAAPPHHTLRWQAIRQPWQIQSDHGDHAPAACRLPRPMPLTAQPRTLPPPATCLSASSAPWPPVASFHAGGRRSCGRARYLPPPINAGNTKKYLANEMPLR